MPQFMYVRHGMKNITAGQLMQVHQADIAIEKAWADPASGTVYCLSEAPSAEAVQRLHGCAGHRADEVHPCPWPSDDTALSQH
ncbi:nickel-binding protein [Streptomyces sp. LN549]|uniref:nickel-binding protein n=1 Tax=Streptomyces sp. LN549 TaxID=3112979 RepID=UPI003717A85D